MKKRSFLLAIGFAVVRHYYVIIVYDIIKFQIGLVNLSFFEEFRWPDYIPFIT